MKKALITGITGQDGAYLAEFLLNKGYKVFGTYRRLSTPNFWRLQYLNLFEKVELLPCDLLDSFSIIETLQITKPDEIYNLAAQSFVGASFEQPIASGEITGLGVTKILEAIRLIIPEARFYQASTSEMYGDNSFPFQDENTVFSPSSPYAASTGILFNHESPLRGLEFVTRKITNAVAKIKLGLDNSLELGNLDSKRDWGYAPEYVEAMWMMLQHDMPDDFVIATNETHSIYEFLEVAFSRIDLDWKKYVGVDEKYKRPVDVNYLKGDFSKSKNALGWEPRTSFNELVNLMVDKDLERWTS
jgi:GDPmannose 4,6-dehydratase